MLLKRALLLLLFPAVVLAQQDEDKPPAKPHPLKASTQRLIDVTPGAKQALALAAEGDITPLTTAALEQLIIDAGGSLTKHGRNFAEELEQAGATEQFNAEEVAQMVAQTSKGKVNAGHIRRILEQREAEQQPSLVGGRQTDDCPGLVYGAGKREICLPLAELSFADQVVAFTAGEKPSKIPFNNPQKALGEPDYRSTKSADFISIGCDGELIVQFTDNVLVDVAGPDLYIFEVGPFVEKTELAISQDGSNWLEVGVIEGARSDVDINGLVAAGEHYNYVRLRNAGRSCGGMHSGADIDAIAAVGAEIRLSLDSALLFDIGKYQLKPEAQAALDQLLAKVAAYGPDIRVTVEGHTDSTGSDSDNKLLSEQRAKSVWQYLAPGLKLSAEQVNIKGYGESRPVASNDDEEGRALNRRVDLLIKPGSRLKR
uniref:Outer membrane lipoprotein omp16 n=1 Tax=Rheinheimera sp. BAL341 TaxID=1708203 RepID=A0A486XJ12_9GAMM